MRHLAIVVLALFFFAITATAQEEGEPGGYFGGPVAKYTVIRGQGALLFGGRGGWIITPSLSLGGGLYGTMTEVDAREGAVANAPGPLDVKFDSFGIDLEYALHPNAPTHLTLTAFFGGGAARYVRNRTDEQHGETDFLLVLEPSAGVEQRVTDWAHVNLAVSYRLVRGVEQAGLTNSDFDNIVAALALKLGRF